jgi:hypothetical protein
VQRRQSVPHTFEESLSAEKAKLEAQIAKLKPGPQRDGLARTPALMFAGIACAFSKM